MLWSVLKMLLRGHDHFPYPTQGKPRLMGDRGAEAVEVCGIPEVACPPRLVVLLLHGHRWTALPKRIRLRSVGQLGVGLLGVGLHPDGLSLRQRLSGPKVAAMR